MLFFWWGKVDSNFVRNVYYDFLRLKQSILFLYANCKFKLDTQRQKNEFHLSHSFG